jgi:ribosomal protein S18 acetylase RimI-like enzyme
MSDRATTHAVALRPATRDDRAALMALVTDGIGGTAYRELPLHFLRLALQSPSAESRAIVAERDGAVVGGAAFGTVAGTIGTGRIHFVTVAAGVRRLGIASRLCEAAVADLSARGARSIVVEMPDDQALLAGRALLRQCRFTEVARVPDYYRDDVALIVLHRAILPTD